MWCADVVSCVLTSRIAARLSATASDYCSLAVFNGSCHAPRVCLTCRFKKNKALLMALRFLNITQTSCVASRHHIRVLVVAFAGLC